MSESPSGVPAHADASASQPADIDPRRFAAAFQQFLETTALLAGEEGRERFPAVLGEHLGVSPRSLDPVRQEFPDWRWADVDAALDSLAVLQDLRGVLPSDEASGLSDLLTNQYGSYELGAVERTAVPVGPGTVRHVATNALRLFEVDGTPVVVFATRSHPHTGGGDGGAIVVEVLCPDERMARSVLADVDAHVRENSVLRGQVVSFVDGGFDSDSVGIEFHARPRVRAEDLILPEGARERVEAAVLGMSANAAELRAVGQHLSRGVLLYGPPGTGKTHTVRYLLSQSPDTTAILLQGEALSRIRQAAATAKSLGRAIIVLEDADLIAADRDFSEGERSVLFDVLDILDGLDEDADIAFLLTTNRVDVLEEALALRPGRIDLAVEVPLPAHALRERLFARYARELPVTPAGIAAAAEASAGTTGSFAKEAVRRAVLDALAANAEADDARLLTAVHALMSEAAELRQAMGRDALQAEDGEFPDEKDLFAPDEEPDDEEFDDGQDEPGWDAGGPDDGGGRVPDEAPAGGEDPFEDGLSGEDLLVMDEEDD